MSYDILYKELQQGHYHPVYLLHGEEPYFIDQISDYIQTHALSEIEKSFNLHVVYGFDTTPARVVEICKTFPMLGEKQVVILNEAQKLKGDGNKNNGVEKLEAYLKAPLSSTILVINYKYAKIDGRSKFWKNTASKLAGFESKILYDNQLPEFIQQLVKSKGYKVDEKALAILIEYIGNDLSNIEKSLEKLFLNIKPQETILPIHIEKYIGISIEYSMFELQKALAYKNKSRAYTIAQHYIKHAKENPPVLIASNLYSFFSKAYLYFSYSNIKEAEANMGLNFFQKKDFYSLRQNFTAQDIEKIILLLADYDLKIKGIDFNGEKEPLLYDLIFKILNVGALSL